MRYLSLCAVVLLMAAVMPAFSQTGSADDRIHDKVLQKLAADRDVGASGIEVNVRDGVVTLTGKVRLQKQKSKAERLAHKVKGVKSVVNQIQIELPSGPPAQPTK